MGSVRISAEPALGHEGALLHLEDDALRGGGSSVGVWARDHGFQLTPDAPEVLDFYAARSPIFMAARFNADAAKQRNQDQGEGTPVHLTIPMENPWVPLRILGLGKGTEDIINANVFLLTPSRPNLLPEVSGRSSNPGARPAGSDEVAGDGVFLDRSEQASKSLLDDLRSDKGMEWVPQSMWFTAFHVGEEAGRLRYDLAVDASGRGRPSLVAAGLRRPVKPAPPTTASPTTVGPPSSVAPTTVTAAPELALGPPPDQLIAPRRAAAESPPLDVAIAGVGALAGAALATAAIARRRLLRR